MRKLTSYSYRVYTVKKSSGETVDVSQQYKKYNIDYINGGYTLYRKSIVIPTHSFSDDGKTLTLWV